MSSQNEAVVSVKDLTLKLRKFTVNYGSFDIFPGDFVIVKGRNGSGKSTFLSLFNLQGIDYFKIVNGGIYFNDPAFPEKSIHRYNENGRDYLSDLRHVISFIGQKDKFLSYSSAYSYIMEVCKRAIKYNLSKEYSGVKNLFRFWNAYFKERRKLKDLIKKYFKEYLAESFMTENYSKADDKVFKRDYRVFMTQNMSKWSGGQQKMINVLSGIIKAEICGLRLMVMDEPLNNLDGKNKKILNDIIQNLRNTNKDIAIIVITHCQIFDGINKTLTITEDENESVCKEKFAVFEVKNEIAHKECLENYK